MSQDPARHLRGDDGERLGTLRNKNGAQRAPLPATGASDPGLTLHGGNALEGVRNQSKLARINLAVVAVFVLACAEPRLGQKRTHAGFCSLRYLRHSSGLVARRGASNPRAGGRIAPFGQSREQCAEGAPTRGAVCQENAGPRPRCLPQDGPSPCTWSRLLDAAMT